MFQQVSVAFHHESRFVSCPSLYGRRFKEALRDFGKDAKASVRLNDLRFHISGGATLLYKLSYPLSAGA